ncbi:MAG: hypothetical protein P8176_05905 [Gammaproteobacteria bacterium]|jgi:hypothetical protein
MKNTEQNPEELKEKELARRQEHVVDQVDQTRESVAYARDLLSRSERVRREFSTMMFGEIDPMDFINQAPVSMRQEVYDMLRPYCSDADLAPLNVDGVTPEVKPLAGRLRYKSLV